MKTLLNTGKTVEEERLMILEMFHKIIPYLSRHHRSMYFEVISVSSLFDNTDVMFQYNEMIAFINELPK